MTNSINGLAPRQGLVAVVVPLPNRKELTPDERVSLRHLLHFLGRYDKYLVIPESLGVDYPGFLIKRFSNSFFGSLAAHNRLMLSLRFYEAFRNYKYILIYHPDALVFSDQLLQWCETDLDYIGAPWLNCNDSPWVKTPRVGNGGFSLRKVESFLQVLRSPVYAVDPAIYWQTFWGSRPKHTQYVNLPRKFLKRLRLFNGARWETFRWRSRTGCNDDHFWSDRSNHYFPDFKIADVQTGLRFAFEVAPRFCFELNNYKLPFGCHAWPKFDRAFWEPHLLNRPSSELVES
jgi:hypothetical protein